MRAILLAGLGMFLGGMPAMISGETYQSRQTNFTIEGPEGWKLLNLRKTPYYGFFGPPDEAKDFVPNIGFSNLVLTDEMLTKLDTRLESLAKEDVTDIKNHGGKVTVISRGAFETDAGDSGYKITYEVVMPDGGNSLRQSVYYFKPGKHRVFTVAGTNLKGDASFDPLFDAAVRTLVFVP